MSTTELRRLLAKLYRYKFAINEASEGGLHSVEFLRLTDVEAALAAAERPTGLYHGLVRPEAVSSAVGAHLFKKKVKEQAAALDFVRSLLHAPIPKIALENPVGIISSRIRKPTQIIQPYHFGHDASKKTCLWLEGLPPLRGTKVVEGRYACINKHVWPDHPPDPFVWTSLACPTCGEMYKRRVWGNQTPSGQNKLGPSDDRWKKRSQTYRGIAEAMAEQWGVL